MVAFRRSRRLVGGLLTLLVPASMLVSAGGATAAPAHTCNLPILMSDGAKLRANLTRPEGDAVARPTILIVTGYNKDLATRRGNDCASGDAALTAAGYNVLTVDDRGTGSSDGRWGRWDDRTQQDYAEVLDWLDKQPWSDGNVGTTGTSYLAITSLLVAATGHKSVKAVWADLPMADTFRDGTTYFGGNLNTTFFPAWLGLTQAFNTNTPTQAVQGEPIQEVALNAYDHWTAAPVLAGGEVMRAALLGDETSPSSPFDSPVHRRKSPGDKAPNIKAAVFYTGGWFDIFQRGEAYLWNQLQNVPENGKKWVQSPIYHAAGDNKWDAMGLGSKSKMKLDWFDHWLKGTDNKIEQIPDLHQWVVGAEKWETQKAWPAKATEWQRFHLSPASSGSGAKSLNDGSLTTEVPTTPAQTRLPFVPVGGVCNRSTHQWSMGFGAGVACADDQQRSEATTLTFSTPPLADGLHLAGPLNLSVWAELDKPDASFYVALTDVAPDGKSTQISSGALNASHRALDESRTWRNKAGDVILPWHPFTKEALADVPLNQALRYDIEVFPTNWQLAPGHRLRVVLGTADTPHYAVPQDRLQKMLGGTIKVLSGPQYPSALIVPLQPKV